MATPVILIIVGVVIVFISFLFCGLSFLSFAKNVSKFDTDKAFPSFYKYTAGILGIGLGGLIGGSGLIWFLITKFS